MPEVLAAPSPPVVLLIALAGAPLTIILGWGRPRLAAILAIAAATVTTLAVVAAWSAGGGTVSVPWIPSLGIRVLLEFDGLSAVYGLLAAGIGTAVLVYASAYIPRHLRHHGRDPAEATWFYGLIVLFMGAMVGLVITDDLFLLFIFWDLTAVVSYFLIGFDRDEPASRPAALMALLVTAGSAVLMLAGIVVLWLMEGTASVQALNAGHAEGATFSVAVGLIVVAALAKSAQVPLHFWLPRAMVAPTPVSAYLHSAAMVAAGVFLLARIFPLVHRSLWLPDLLVAVGAASMLVGSMLAIGRDEMKRLLAYSTIAQYGYVVVMLGLGEPNGAIGAAFYVMAHGLAKSALFLTAGAVTEATGRSRLSEIGGLLRGMPALAVASGIAAATIAALPLTIGFFKDELFFAAMHERGPVYAAAAIGGAALTLAYMGRFWGALFLGAPRDPLRGVPGAMTGPVVVLAALCLLGGIWVDPENHLANVAGSDSLLTPAAVDLAYHLDPRIENLMALAAYAIGALILLTLGVWTRASMSIAALAERLGPDRLYRGALDSINALSDRLHGYELHDLRGRVATVLLPVGVFVGMGLVFTSNEGAFVIGQITGAQLPVILLLAALCAAALTAAAVTNHLAAALMLSAVGYPLAAVYAFIGSPDVALVAILMETMFSLLFVGFLAAIRDRPRIEGLKRDPAEAHLGRDRAIGLIAAVAAFIIVWGILSKPAAIESAAEDQIALTPSAHARDVVTAILSDFRGLDTMGEITVIGIAMVGLLTLLQRPWRRSDV
jgi:multicomponent Na+:H+ antiporter subunit A